jgi:hypothetical protein
MGVDFYSCDNCGETFPDCGPHIRCEHGHTIGPCCYPHNEEDWPEGQTTEDEEGSNVVMAAHCPVCARGGSEAQRLDEAQATIARLTAELEAMRKAMLHALSATSAKVAATCTTEWLCMGADEIVAFIRKRTTELEAMRGERNELRAQLRIERDQKEALQVMHDYWRDMACKLNGECVPVNHLVGQILPEKDTK